MDFTFEPISLDRQREYRQYLKQSPQKASDYSFINIWGWADEYGLQWAWEPGLVWIRQTVPQTLYWAPVGDWQNTDWQQALKRFDGLDPRFGRIPGQLAHIWEAIKPPALRLEPDRDNWDYLYSVDALAALEGRRFHKKKNLL